MEVDLIEELAPQVQTTRIQALTAFPKCLEFII